jgi:hypothetical protein
MRYDTLLLTIYLPTFRRNKLPTFSCIFQKTVILRHGLKCHKVIRFWSLGICFHSPKRIYIQNNAYVPLETPTIIQNHSTLVAMYLITERF